MPRSFSKEEQEILYKRIFKVGRDFFYKNGFKKTSIKDITREVGIASGSFYQFFHSKEALFMKIYFEENYLITKEIMDTTNLTGNPKVVIKEIFFRLASESNQETILGRHNHQEEFLNIIKKLDTREKDLARREVYCLFLPLLERWQREGLIKKISPDLILTFFDAIYYVEMHQEDLGASHFPILTNYLFEFVLEGILEKGEENNAV
ncbi:transcriptional regulator, TetR family [Natronincola peptidivorans]|uniref:Transcriptional regulator, TetR family n=1 Tax=Natronincola peptidivorans TaxID=426128 RepID=A0A1I0AVT4_9FIRM|nr:TetR/AcrR family transcriptional regulator [Natronincola peptidivorans]SES98526.1 transcriptional regulator, TetR family [Natronincola peptidivorans]